MTDSMRDSITAALETVGEEDPTQNYEETEQEVDTYEEDPDTAAEPASDTPEPETALVSPEPQTEAVETNDSIKAPVDWGPQERESWSKIPRQLQEKVMAREKEVSTLMQNTADARRTHEEFGGLVQQYGSVLSGVAGDTPMAAVSNLFSTVANLRMGTPIQKAQIVSDMISDFGVDIQTLDAALTGKAPPAGQQQNAELERMLAERMAPFEQMMGQKNAYEQQQVAQRQQNANNEVQQFSQNAEFLADVRHDMADLIDLADKHGRDISMQEAYDKACALNPQIQAVIQKRTQHQQLTGGNNAMANKRRAASSITGNRAGNGQGSGGASIRDTISEAWDSQGRV